MSEASPWLDACLVLHKAQLVTPLLRAASSLAHGAGLRLRALLLVTRSGSIDLRAVRERCMKLGISVIDCRNFDDTYFDFSAYGEAAQFFHSSGSDGALFLNDTVIAKHDSGALRGYMARALASTCRSRFGFPLMLGPFRHSEFSIGDGAVDEFAATFLFHLNGPALPLLCEVVRLLPDVESSLRAEDCARTGVDAALLRFCEVHSIQLRARYAGSSDAESLLARKLSTAYAERLLARLVKSRGVLWYVASGLTGRLLVPLQAAANRSLRRLLSR